MSLTMPSERTQTILRWGVCFAVVLLAHALAVAALLHHSDFAEAPPSADVVELDVALGDPQEQVDPAQYAPPKPVEQEVQQQNESEQKEAEVVLPKEEQQSEPTPVQPAPQIEEQEAKAPPKASPDMMRKWQMTVNTRLNQFKRYPSQARSRGQEGTVTVAFVLDTDGHVVSSKIVRSSGSAILDKETLDLIARAQPYPVPPQRSRRRGSLSPGSNRLWVAIARGRHLR
jgi:periplasmic protein TonB